MTSQRFPPLLFLLWQLLLRHQWANSTNALHVQKDFRTNERTKRRMVSSRHGITTTWIAPPRRESQSRSVIQTYIPCFGTSKRGALLFKCVPTAAHQLCDPRNDGNSSMRTTFNLKSWLSGVQCASISGARGECCTYNLSLLPLEANYCMLCTKGKDDPTANNVLTQVLYGRWCILQQATIYKHRHQLEVTRRILVSATAPRSLIVLLKI